jgi:hypothetical protein
MVLTFTGRDLEIEGIPGRILHAAAAGVDKFRSRHTVDTGDDQPSHLLMPPIPAVSSAFDWGGDQPSHLLMPLIPAAY